MHRVPSASTERPGVEDVAAATLSLSTPAKMFVGSNDAGDTRHRLPRSLAASSDFPGQERANATTYSDAAAPRQLMDSRNGEAVREGDGRWGRGSRSTI